MSGNFITKERLREGTWQAFERILARYLEHMGCSEVEVVGGTGDGGADIVALFKGQRWVVQAKYRSGGVIGKDATDEGINALRSYEADTCFVVTNQDFSKTALEHHAALLRQGFDCRLWSGDTLQKFGTLMHEFSSANHALRDYQQTAVGKIFERYDEGGEKALITLATGLGKTVVMSQFVDDYIKENPKHQVLVLAHMTDLVKQLERSCWRRFHRTVETHLWTDGEQPAYRSGVTFATWQSIESARTKGLVSSKDYNLIVIDECHHAPSDSFSALIEFLSPDFLLGVTATPWRGDGVSLRGLFGDPVYSMTVIEGIQQGFLADVDYKMLLDGVDWNEIHNLSRQGFTVKDLNQKLYVPERDMGMIETISQHLETISRPKVLVFCRSIKHAERLQRHFRQVDISSGIIHSNLSRQEKFSTLTNFRTGSLKVLISIEMLNEGIDIPEVNVVVFARVTHSRRIFLQQLGRGLRLSGDKESVLVLDFVADVRRVAQGFSMNREAAEWVDHEEVRFTNGEVVKFFGGGDSFFMEYLADMADVEDLDDTAQLEFPD